MSIIDKDAEIARLQYLVDGYEHWASDIKRLTRALDVELHGDDAAPQASLCDLVGAIREYKKQAESKGNGLVLGDSQTSQPVAVKRLTQREIAEIIRKTEVADMTKDGDTRWVNRMAEALCERQYSNPHSVTVQDAVKVPEIASAIYALRQINKRYAADDGRLIHSAKQIMDYAEAALLLLDTALCAIAESRR